MTEIISPKIPVLVAGALGRMGSEVVKAISLSDSTTLIGAVDTSPDDQGKDIGEALGLPPMNVPISSELEPVLCTASQSFRDNSPVIVDFTHPSVVYKNTRAAIAYGIHPVVGTTGLTQSQLNELNEFSQKASIGAAVIPNFAIGMVLLQQAAGAASAFYNDAELIELHHNKKADAPSGTCIKTAEIMEEIGKPFNTDLIEDKNFIEASRGSVRDSGLRVHSIRLPGLIAHQEVMFGAPGETYILSHNTIDRTAYMPGVLLTIKKVRNLSGLVYGLEKLL